MNKPNCYECKWRRDLAGSAHSTCHHPINERLTSDPILGLLSMLGSVGRVDIPPVKNELNVTGNQHGIKNGWFIWPYNFDPVWLLTCDGFEPESVKMKIFDEVV